MPTTTQFLEHTQIFPAEETLTNHPQILTNLIDYITLNPDILTQNQQQCYAYPNKSSQILSIGSSFRALIQKKQRINKQGTQNQKFYPYLQRMFKNLISNRRQMKELSKESSQDLQIQECLLGYVNRVLISLAKKTPQIYQYFKDQQEVMTALVKDNQFLKALQEFWNIFIIQSTMSLYIFLKNLYLRALMFRIIDENDNDNLIVYEAIAILYQQITKKLQLNFLPQDERQQLQQICGGFHDQDFITLMILKLSSSQPTKTYYIARFFNNIIKNPLNNLSKEQQSNKNSAEDIQNRNQQCLQIQSSTQSKHASEKYSLPLSFLSENYVEVVEEYFESVQDASDFMDTVRLDQLEVLKYMIGLLGKQLLAAECQANLLKRLLVYSSIHKNNSILHYMLIKTIDTIYQKSTNITKQKVFEEINVIRFLMKNSDSNQNENGSKTQSRFGYNSLVYQICKYWMEKDQLLTGLEEEEKEFVNLAVRKKEEKLVGLVMYKKQMRKGYISEFPHLQPQTTLASNIESVQSESPTKQQL